MKKILSVVCKGLLWLAAGYLVLGFIVLPFVIKLVIEKQGSQMLKHPVKVRSVLINPLMFSAELNGFAIWDDNKEIMAGFDKFKVDVSFLALIKKNYRVELVEIDGLKANVRLLASGKVNFLSLVPAAAETTPPVQTATAAKTAEMPAPAGQKEALPKIVFDLILIKNGQVHFVDETLVPNFVTTVGNIGLSITGLATDPASKARVAFKATLDKKGVISVETLLQPFLQPLELETSVILNNYALTVLSPYVGKYTGRALDNGQFELRMDYRIANNKLTASHKLLVQHFEFGQKVASKDALGLPFGLALALLEDANGQIKVSLPITGDMSDPKFEYWPLVGQVVRDFFFKIVTKPFAFLGAILGGESGSDELGYVRFLPGKSDLSDEEKGKLSILAQGLKDHPKLRLEINGSYDADIDWKAIKADVLRRDYEALKKESSGTEMKLYQMLYQRSFGIRDLWALTNKYKVREGQYDEPKVIEEIKRQLIENAPVDMLVMNALAKVRAQRVYDAIVALGLDTQKLSMGLNHAAQGSMGYVPLDFVLTVFEGPGQAQPATTDNAASQ